MRPIVFLVICVIALIGSPAPGQSLPPSPANAPEQWVLAFVDVETTGLDPDYHEMIDIGMIVTDLEGVEIDRLFLRLQPLHPERTSDEARAINAFDESRWREHGAVSPAAAVAAIIDFHHRTSDGRSVLLIAYNSPFDASFVDHLFKANGRSWRELFHFFILDLPSMAWSRGSRRLGGTALASALGVDDEPHVAEQHTGITGAALNVRIYRALLH